MQTKTRLVYFLFLAFGCHRALWGSLLISNRHILKGKQIQFFLEVQSLSFLLSIPLVASLFLISGHISSPRYSFHYYVRPADGVCVCVCTEMPLRGAQGSSFQPSHMIPCYLSQLDRSLGPLTAAPQPASVCVWMSESSQSPLHLSQNSSYNPAVWKLLIHTDSKCIFIDAASNSSSSLKRTRPK